MRSLDERRFPALQKVDSGLLEEIRNLLTAQVNANPYGDDSNFAQSIATLPCGLKAMAATHWLDISLTLDSITWHFENFGEAGLVKATEEGLRELGLEKLADCFAEAKDLMVPLLAQRVVGEGGAYELLQKAGLKEQADEVNSRAWALDNLGPERSLIYESWIRYARRKPELVFNLPDTSADGS
jgi:hypothetical protein